MRWPAAVMLPPEPDALLDRFASLAARTLRAPMAVLSLIDDSHQVVLPGAAGMPEPWQHDRTMDWAHSLCRFVTGGTDLVVVDDVAADPRAWQYPDAVDAFGVQSWIAAPLRFSTDFVHFFDSPGAAPVGHQPPTEADEQAALLEDVAVVLEVPEIHDIGELADADTSGAAPSRNAPAVRPEAEPGRPEQLVDEHAVWGVLCVMDTAVRVWDERERELVQDLAAAAAAELRSRVLTSRAISAERRMATTLATSQAVQARSQLLLALSRGLSQAETVQDVSSILASLLREQVGVDHFGLAVLDSALSDARHESVNQRLRYVDMATFPPGTDPSWASFDMATSSALPVRAVRTGQSFFCDHKSAVYAADPHLRDQGEWDYPGAVVVVPLQTGPRGRDRLTLGALVLIWPTARDTSDPADRALWAALADYTAQTLARVKYVAERRSSAETLQRSLLTALPQPNHLELRARYVPAATGEHVGGDWYDAMVLPDGATTIAIGDVTGHDMVAAASMGQLRGMLRAFAFDREEPPTEVVTRLDRAIAGLHINALASLVLARIEQSSQDAAAGNRVLRWTNAGHPPPVLLHSDGSTEVLETVPELLVGLLTDTARSNHTFVLPPDATLLLYTDGLIEHRGRALSEGIEDLRRVLSSAVGLPLEGLMDRLVTELVGDSPDDDCAMLAVRTHREDRPRPTEAGPNRTP